MYAQSTQRRFSRWLHNGRIQAYRGYAPIIRRVLLDWQDPVMYLALDTTMLWDTYCVDSSIVDLSGASGSVGVAGAAPCQQ